ncbi:MAG TPA: 5-(carboxyamino)imidazole ribonucleotide mutase [Acidimicrobiales bacterium]|nr:5-(carboxyamino)imidazole ribonucleotide mutase [Acidimicrobiales bacterium]
MSVAIVMGSDSDLPIMRQAAEALEEFAVEWEMRVLSAHRTPEETLSYARSAVAGGIQVIIAGAGGAAHLPGVIAAVTRVPVIGVPIALPKLDGLDSLLSIVQMPKGVPVATVAIDGARNAGLLAVRMLAIGDPDLGDRLDELAVRTAAEVRAKDAKLQQRLAAERSEGPAVG